VRVRDTFVRILTNVRPRINRPPKGGLVPPSRGLSPILPLPPRGRGRRRRPAGSGGCTATCQNSAEALSPPRACRCGVPKWTFGEFSKSASSRVRVWGMLQFRQVSKKQQDRLLACGCGQTICSQKPPSASESSSTSPAGRTRLHIVPNPPIFSRPDSLYTFEKIGREIDDMKAHRRGYSTFSTTTRRLPSSILTVTSSPSSNGNLSSRRHLPDGDISGFRLPDRHNPALSFSCHIHCKFTQ